MQNYILFSHKFLTELTMICRGYLNSSLTSIALCLWGFAMPGTAHPFSIWFRDTFAATNVMPNMKEYTSLCSLHPIHTTPNPQPLHNPPLNQVGIYFAFIQNKLIFELNRFMGFQYIFPTVCSVFLVVFTPSFTPFLISTRNEYVCIILNN